MQLRAVTLFLKAFSHYLAAQRHGKMDASDHKKLGRVFVWNMMEIPAKRGKRVPRLSSITRRKLQKKRRKHRVSSVWEQRVGGSNPLAPTNLS